MTKSLALPCILLLISLAACGHSPPTAQGATPEEAALRAIPKLGVPSDSIQLRGSRITPYGTAILYTVGPDQASEQFMGFVLTEQRGTVWVARDIMQQDLDGAVRNGRYVDVTSRVHDLNGRVGSTFGRVLDPQVTAVEVMFNDGQVLRDTVTPEGMFVLMADDTFAYCEVKALDAQDQVVETVHAEAENACSAEG